jgi:NhaP-type Na+/H+ or K+/H+ antiporter
MRDGLARWLPPPGGSRFAPARASTGAPSLVGDIEPIAILYAVLSLTLARMVPVAVALARTGLRRDTMAFMGLFGPRGLASVVFTLIAIEELHGAGSIPVVITDLATWTILLSVLAHGLSAELWPGSTAGA